MRAWIVKFTNQHEVHEIVERTGMLKSAVYNYRKGILPKGRTKSIFATLNYFFKK